MRTRRTGETIKLAILIARPSALTADVSSFESRRAGVGDSLVLTAAASADTNGADDRSATLQRDTAGEDHDASVVRRMNAEELLSGLAVLGEFRSCEVKRAGRERLVDRDIDAADPRAVHADVGHEVSADIDYGDVHGLADLLRFGFRRCNDLAGVFQSYHVILHFFRRPWIAVHADR